MHVRIYLPNHESLVSGVNRYGNLGYGIHSCTYYVFCRSYVYDENVIFNPLHHRKACEADPATMQCECDANVGLFGMNKYEIWSTYDAVMYSGHLGLDVSMCQKTPRTHRPRNEGRHS